MTANGNKDSGPTIAFWGLGLGIFAYLVFRVLGQPIGHDEATTFLNYVDGPWSRLYENFTLNNHMLFSMAAKITTTVFGDSVFTFRMPSLAASAVFLFALGRILRNSIPSAWIGLLGFALIVLNPMILGYLCVARGYALALAFLVLALSEILDGLHEKNITTGRCFRLALWFAFCLASSLPFVMAAVPLLILFIGCGLVGEKTVESRKRFLVRGTLSGVLPGGILLGSLIAPALLHVQEDNFFYGVTSIPSSALSLMSCSILQQDISSPSTSPAWTGNPDTIHALNLVSLPLLLLAMLWCTLVILRRSAPDRHILRSDGLVLICSIAVVGILLLYGVARITHDLPYPRSRMGIGLIFLFQVAWVGLTGWLCHGKGLPRALGFVTLLGMAAFTLNSVTRLPQWYVPEYRHEARSREVYAKLESLKREDRPLRVASYPYAYSGPIDFYREIEDAEWLEPVLIGIDANIEFDYAILNYRLAPSLSKLLHFVYQDEFTGVVIGERKP